MNLPRWTRLLPLLPLIIAQAVQAQEQTATGYLDASTTSQTHTFIFNAGDTVLVMAEATSGDLDTLLQLYGEGSKPLAENDDYTSSNYDSALVYTIDRTGKYAVTVQQYEQGVTSGDYLLTVTVGDEGLFDYLESISRVRLSGTPRVLDTAHFRIHYTLEGADDTQEAYVELVAQILEEVWRIQIDEMRWPAPPPDRGRDGDDRYDVYIASLKKEDDLTMGYTSSDEVIGDHPNTTAVEEYASTSFLVIENDFSESMSDDERANLETLLRATIAHEFHHAIQMGYDYSETHSWYMEATATWMETATFDNAQDATGYVTSNFTYPELCFGTLDDPDGGFLQYGDWMFIQSLVDAHGENIVRELWKNIAFYEGLEPLAQTLSNHGETIPQALARYRAQNLARDYTLAPQFDSTVWMEAIIRSAGEWSPVGEGVQELGANYYYLKQKPGVYRVSLDDDSGLLEVWAVGIRDGQVEAFLLGSDGAVSTEGYSYVYLMVFNPVYDDDVSDCAFYPYSLHIEADSSATAALTPVYTFSAEHFEPLALVE